MRSEVAGTTAGLANCGEWKRATPRQRQRTVEDLRGQLTAQDDAKARSVLSDERAYEVFQRACRQSYADGLRLYKLYVHAAASSRCGPTEIVREPQVVLQPRRARQQPAVGHDHRS